MLYGLRITIYTVGRNGANRIQIEFENIIFEMALII